MPILTHGATVLETVARYGSIRKAAEQMNATASALNRQIHNLEVEYGQPLFERLPRGMRPTEAGQALIDQVRRLQQEVRDTNARVERFKTSFGGEVSIGFMECLAPDFLPAALRSLRADFAGARLNAIVAGTNSITELIKSGAVDLGVMFNAPHSIDLTVIATAQLPFGVVMHPQHRLAKRAVVDVDEILNEYFILTDESLTIGPISTLMLERIRSPVNKVAVTNSIAFQVALLREGMGISILTRLDVLREVERGELRFVPLSGARMSAGLSLLSRDVRALTRTARAMADIIGNNLRELERKLGEVR